MKHFDTCYAELLTHTPDPLLAIEKAGRTCYKSQPHCTSCDGSGQMVDELAREVNPCLECAERSERFVRGLLSAKPYPHTAMIEFADATFKFICDRGVTHEEVRHRLCSYAQESTRFCNYAKNKFGNEITVIRPPGLTEEQWARRVKLYEHIEQVYLAELSEPSTTGEKVKPQIARGVLPISLKTEIVHKANFTEWRHILKLRTGQPAHPQIRQMMTGVWNIFHEKWPVIVEDIEPYAESE